MIKQIFDFLAALSMLLVLSPVLLALSWLVKVKLGSPVLFCQTRPGKEGIPFTMYKFRTMIDACDEQGHLLQDQDRLTHFGQFLRASSLDELPELFNVLKGEMSLVGPRPLLMEYLPLYSAEQARRHEVKPGITGWAQVNGCRGETKSLTQMETRVEHDIWYINNWSIWLDLRIIFKTAYKGFSQASAY